MILPQLEATAACPCSTSVQVEVANLWIKLCLPEQYTGCVQELPFVVETATMIKHKAALEARMKEIEDGMRLFSRSKVLVQTEV